MGGGCWRWRTKLITRLVALLSPFEADRVLVCVHTVHKIIKGNFIDCESLHVMHEHIGYRVIVGNGS
jgi:hypothetical protein